MDQSNVQTSPNSSQSEMLCEDLTKTDVSKYSELFTGDSLLELCNSYWMPSPSVKKDVQPYLRGCKWSPDGTCCLCVVNQDGFHVMELPRDLYEGCPPRNRMITLLPAVIHVKESGTVYDFCWYPKMNSHYAETCSWISTKINSPIQMWDAYNGSLRCSYRGFNAVDEMEPAISVTFINEGHRIVGGYKNCLRTFDVERPGRDFLEHKIKSPASCFATHSNLLAVGSWNANIKLFSIVDNGTYRSIGNLHAHTGGITHLQFTPDGTKLVSGARKDNSLCVWDVRYHRRPLNILKRSVSTNQRIYFDISPCGRYLVSGGTDGVIRVWDDKLTKWTQQFDVKNGNQENATFRFPLYRDCCNSISLHPSRPILATGSGQFHFLDPVKVLDSESDSGTNCDDGTITEEVQSAIHGPSSVDQTFVEKSEVETEEPGTNIIKEIVLLKNTCSEFALMNSKKEFTNKTSDENVTEVFPINEMKTGDESPPRKKTKRCTDDKLNDIDPLVPTMGNSSLELIHGRCPTNKLKLNGNKSEDNKCNDSKLDINDEEITNVTNESRLLLNEECNVISSKSPEDDNSKQFVLHTCTKLTKIQETHSVSNEPVLTKEEESPENVDRTKSNLIDTLNLRSIKTDSKFEETKLKECDVSPSNISLLPVQKPAENNSLDSALESDDDYNDINENKMKYSSYAENNLTFWWIAKT